MRRVVDFIFVFVVAFFFTACGGGGGGSAPITDNPPTTIYGVAVDNYIKGATVCIDTNKNNDCNDEASSNRTTTASNGTFTFSDVTPTDDMVIIAYGGEDNVTNESFPYLVKNIATNTSNGEVVLSSINTLITDYKFENNTTLGDAKTNVSTFLDVNSTKAIQDVIANKTSNQTEFLRSLKLFQMIAAINDTNNSIINSANSFKLLARAIDANSSLRHDQNMTIDTKNINSSSSYQPVLFSQKEFFYYPDMSPLNQFSIVAYDPNVRSLSYSLVNTKDYNEFNISGANLSFKTPKTVIINPTDANGDGIYEVDVNISNGITSLIKTFKVEVKKYNKSVVPVLLDTNISIEDNLTIGSIIGSIGLSSSGNDDGIIKYETVNTNNYFDINWTTGNIYKTADLNVTTGEHNTSILTIRAKNSAGWSSEKNATITIYDAGQLNSTATIANQTFNNIYENNASQIVGTVTVLSTGGPTLTIDDFNITSGGADFNISTSGVITTKRAFNFETEPTHTLKVVAKNTNGWGNEATITVNILDVNEKPEVTSTVQDLNVSFGESPIFTFNINDGDSLADQNITINATSSEGNVTLSNVTSSISNSGTLSLTLTGVDPGESNITVTMTDNGGTANGGVNTHNFSFKATVRSNGWKIYENRRLANNNTNGHTVTFDGITYSWNSTKQWYETATTILMPVQILKSAKNAYRAGNFKLIPDGITPDGFLDGHYYVNKSEYIWDINKSQTHTSLTKYKNANGVDNNITAKNNYFQHDAYHNFFVSMVTLNSDQNINPKPYKYWIDPLLYPATESDNADYNSVNFIDANDTNTTYGTGEVYSSYFNNSTNEINKIDVNNTTESSVSQCSKMYGKGWRIPTAYEMGLTTDDTASISPIGGSNSGFIPAYIGDDVNNDGSMIFSSSLHSMVNGYYYIIALEQIDYGNNGLWTLKKVDKATTAGIRCVYQP